VHQNAVHQDCSSQPERGGAELISIAEKKTALNDEKLAT